MTMSLDVRAIDTSDLSREPAPVVDVCFRVFIDEEVFDRTVARGNEDTSREVGGVLVGRLLRDDSGPYLRVSKTIDALHAEEKGTELTFTHETWEHINAELDRDHAGDTIVGWWHTHPGFGVFLSDRDEFIHKSFFDLPYQIALVYDPKSRDHGVFTWREGSIARSRSYWVGRHEHLWDGDRAAGTDGERPAEQAPSEPATRRAGEARDEPEPWAGLATVAAIALILGALLGWWYGSRGSADVPTARADATEAARAIRQLETELVRLWRQTMDKQEVLPQLDKAITGLEAARRSLADGAGDEARGHLDEAHAVVRRLRSSYGEASALLTRLALAARGRDARAEAEQKLTRSLIANLYSEVAADVAKTDKRRARRLLINAAQLDPDNHERYESQLQSFDKKARLPRPRPRTKSGGSP